MLLLLLLLSSEDPPELRCRLWFPFLSTALLANGDE